MFGAFDLSHMSSVVGIFVVLMQMLKSIRCENFLLTQSLGGAHVERERGFIVGGKQCVRSLRPAL